MFRYSRIPWIWVAVFSGILVLITLHLFAFIFLFPLSDAMVDRLRMEASQKRSLSYRYLDEFVNRVEGVLERECKNAFDEAGRDPQQTLLLLRERLALPRSVQYAKGEVAIQPQTAAPLSIDVMENPGTALVIASPGSLRYEEWDKGDLAGKNLRTRELSASETAPPGHPGSCHGNPRRTLER